MSEIRHRPYTGAADLRAMKEILDASARAGIATFHRGDLDWWRFPRMPGADVERFELWYRGAECAGFVVHVERDASFDVITHPDWRGGELERALLRWADARLVAIARNSGRKRATVTAYVFAENAFQRAILAEMGYAESDDVILYEQALPPEPLPAVALPAGFRWLPPMRLEWAAARAAAHADAFHPSRMTPAAYRRLLREAPDYDGALDVVAVAPDGRHAAFAIVWLDEENGIGLFEPVGTRRAFQRRGLGHAVLREGLRRLRARGMRQAIVGCEAGIAGNRAFYETAGFREQTRILACRRQISRPAADEI